MTQQISSKRETVESGRKTAAKKKRNAQACCAKFHLKKEDGGDNTRNATVRNALMQYRLSVSHLD
ncbi:Uncharacterized protein ChrSV_1354 [Chromobacterium vaccinii]|nr:Uncharacterized protein ChrSW_1354 [Chromobacterium vaccinii]QND88812.1 Uncharacterized protein ChrSV_1354 [Chromobacterium vaccinii]